MGDCNLRSVGCEAAGSDGESHGTAGKRVQALYRRQHGMGICNRASPPDEKLQAAMAIVSVLRACEFRRRGVANTAWAIATANLSDEKL
jgi:hypothetical protein